MSEAYKCDVCGEFHDGDPYLTAKLSLETDSPGPLGSLFGATGGHEEAADLCSDACLEELNLNILKQRVSTDIETPEESTPELGGEAEP